MLLGTVFSSFDREFRDVSDSILHHWTEIDFAAIAANIEEVKNARELETVRRERMYFENLVSRTETVAVQVRSDIYRWLSPSNVHDDFRKQQSECMPHCAIGYLTHQNFKISKAP